MGRAAFTRAEDVSGENSLQPRGAGGRAVQQVTGVATSSPAVVLSCIAALTRAISRSNVASGTKARGWRAVALERQASGLFSETTEPPPNNAIKPTPEQALRSNGAVLPARLIATLEFI
jgi:hypothetical protein